MRKEPLEKALDEEWYRSMSTSRGLPERCPIASPTLCPRYFHSALLITKHYFQEEPREELLAYKPVWKNVCAFLDDYPSASYSGDELYSIQNLCPEMMHRFYGLFARSYWMDEGEYYNVHPLHFSGCSEYWVYGNRKQPRNDRKKVGLKERWNIFSRDNFTCQYCGRKPPEVTLEIDHKLAVSNGGANEEENLITSCFDCNRGKGSSQC